MDQEQFQLIAENIAGLSARVCVNELLLSALLAAHPNPKAIQEFWNRHLAEAADRGFENQALPAFSETLQRELAHWSGALAAAAARKE